jgi:PhnB protein
MNMALDPYLNFGGRTEEAISLYQKALGAEVQMLLRFKDSSDPIPEGRIAKGWEEKVMHSCLKVGDSLLMASDGCGAEDSGFKGFSLSYGAKDSAHAESVFAALASGGQSKMPLGKTFFSPCFGMVEDRFGVNWIIIVPQPSGSAR